MKKVCGFYVSSIHLVTMILPYVRELLGQENEIKTFFEHDLEDNINKILSNLIVSEEDKQKILKINWKNRKVKRYSNIEKSIKKILESNKQINLLVSGTERYIKETNNVLENILEKYENKIDRNKITVINCYEVTEFNDNIRDILNNHSYLLNTSGMHKIEDVFEDYKKKIVK